jgi:hypothetical protein
MKKKITKSVNGANEIIWNEQTSDEICEKLKRKGIALSKENIDFLLENYLLSLFDHKQLIRSLYALGYNTIQVIAIFMIIFKMQLSEANELVVLD